MNTIKTMSVETHYTEDYLRQQGIFIAPTDVTISIIGAGGIGSWAALGLSKIGFRNIEIWDGDTVESHNIPNQLFNLGAIGQNKAVYLCDYIGKLTPIPHYWNGEKINSNIVIIAVDKMETRKQIVSSQNTASLIIDGRIGGELIRVLSVSPIDFGSRKFYLDSFYSDDDAVQLPCTARSIIDVGLFVGGIITNLVRRFIKTNSIIREVIFDASNLDILKITKP